MATQTETRSGGIGFLGALGIAFIVLKLTSVIHWSWWWVLLPIWGPWAFVGFILLIVFVLALAGIID